MMCPLNKKFTICQDANGFFMGAKDGDRICCRITDYVSVYASVLSADKYSIPVRSACTNSDCVLCKEVAMHE